MGWCTWPSINKYHLVFQRIHLIIFPKINLDQGCIRRKSQRGLQRNNWDCIRPEGRGHHLGGGRGCIGRGQPWREGGSEGEQSLTITSAIRTTKVGEHTSILRGEELNEIIFDILQPPLSIIFDVRFHIFAPQKVWAILQNIWRYLSPAWVIWRYETFITTKDISVHNIKLEIWI